MTPPIEPTELQELVNKNIEQIKETLESEEDQISKYEARISENESQIAKDKAKSIENDRWFNLLGLSSGIMAALIAIASLHGSKLRNEASMNLGNSLFYWNLAEGASIKYDIILLLSP
jgi:Na+/phosphate symporter